MAAAQIVDATVLPKERVSDDLLRRAVIEDLEPLTASSDVLATSFDNLIRFRVPCHSIHYANSVPMGRRTYKQQLH